MYVRMCVYIYIYIYTYIHFMGCQGCVHLMWLIMCALRCFAYTHTTLSVIFLFRNFAVSLRSAVFFTDTRGSQEMGVIESIHSVAVAHTLGASRVCTHFEKNDRMNLNKV